MISDKEFAAIVRDTKSIVLSAVRTHLPVHYFYAIDDVVQETYLRAFKALQKGSFRGDSAVGSWLFTIARNESIRIAARLDREEEKSLRHGRWEMMKDNSDAASDAEDILSLVSMLPDDYHCIFSLLLQGKKVVTISQELEIPLGTVKSRIFRGKAIMKRLRMEALNG
jgi:RNA polymerase sigma-70 factor (ECF subfamily)